MNTDELWPWKQSWNVKQTPLSLHERGERTTRYGSSHRPRILENAVSTPITLADHAELLKDAAGSAFSGPLPPLQL